MTADMPNMIPVHDIPNFWDMLRTSMKAFLAIDYDGTLAPFRSARMDAYPYPGIADLLARIRELTGDMIAVISGRPVAEILRLLGERDIVIVGNNGFELRYPGGATIMKEPEPEQQKGLLEARLMIERLNLGGHLEVKVGGLAFHTRGLLFAEARRLEDQIHRMWIDTAKDYRLDARKFNGGVEIVCRGWNKGDALMELLELQPPGTFSVYIGDDETDEDAFRVMKKHGLGILVGSSRAKKTEASSYLKDIKAVKSFLETWLLCVTERHL
jgi:trehalose-phosphatase